MFASKCWEKYKNDFSSCNVLNYHQGEETGKLRWCGKCPKCASTFLLLAPFIEYDDLVAVFGSNLLRDAAQTANYRALLGIEGVKPFECVGEIEEMQQAYEMATLKNTEYISSSLSLLGPNFDWEETHEHQKFIDEVLEV